MGAAICYDRGSWDDTPVTEDPDAAPSDVPLDSSKVKESVCRSGTEELEAHSPPCRSISMKSESADHDQVRRIISNVSEIRQNLLQIREEQENEANQTRPD